MSSRLPAHAVVSRIKPKSQRIVLLLMLRCITERAITRAQRCDALLSVSPLRPLLSEPARSLVGLRRKIAAPREQLA